MAQWLALSLPRKTVLGLSCERKPTQELGKHANLTQKGPSRLPGSNPEQRSRCGGTALHHLCHLRKDLIFEIALIWLKTTFNHRIASLMKPEVTVELNTKVLHLWSKILCLQTLKSLKRIVLFLDGSDLFPFNWRKLCITQGLISSMHMWRQCNAFGSFGFKGRQKSVLSVWPVQTWS